MAGATTEERDVALVLVSQTPKDEEMITPSASFASAAAYRAAAASPFAATTTTTVVLAAVSKKSSAVGDEPPVAYWPPRPVADVIRIYARGDSMKAQENTRDAFINLPPGSILGPSVMLTRQGEFVLNHDICPSDMVEPQFCPADIRLLTRSEIMALPIRRDVVGSPIAPALYAHIARFLFLDTFLDEFLLPGGHRIFLDIKASTWPVQGVAYPTPSAIVDFLERYRVSNAARWAAVVVPGDDRKQSEEKARRMVLYSREGFYSRVFYNSSNPYVVLNCMELLSALRLPTDMCCIDYNQRYYDNTMGHVFMEQIKAFGYEAQYGNKYVACAPAFKDLVNVDPKTGRPLLQTVLYGVPTIDDAANQGADLFLG